MIYLPEFENETAICEFEVEYDIDEIDDKIWITVAGEKLWRPAGLDPDLVSDSVIYRDEKDNMYYLNNGALYGEDWILSYDEKFEIVEVVNDIDDPEYGIWCRDKDGEYICFVDYEEDE